MDVIPETGKMTVEGKLKFRASSSCLLLPEWIKHATDDARLKFQERVASQLQKAWTRY